MKKYQQWILVLALGLAGPARAAAGGAPGHYTGTAVDAQGQPVAGATVDGYQDASAVAAYTAQDFALKEHTTTDSKGGFTLSAGGGVTIAVVKKEGLAPGWKMFASVLGESSDPVVLTAPTVLAGTVVDEKGQPVADAEVWVGMALPAPEGGAFSQRSLASLIMGKPARDCFSARTSAEGGFRMANFPANAQAELGVRKTGAALRVRAAFNGTLPYTSGQQDIKLTLETAGNIEGKVTVQGTGQPLPGVKLRWLGASGGLSALLDMRDPVLSGADGSFRLADVPPGRAVISAIFPGEPVADWVAENVSVTVAGGETKKDVEVRALKGGVAAISVLSRPGRTPLANAPVTAYSQAVQSSASAVTGADGVARFRLSPGDWNFAVSKEGWNAGQTAAAVVAGQTNRAEVEISPGLKITGTVRDPAGAPVAGAVVSISPNFGNNPEVKTDASGRYEITWQMFNFGNQSFSLMARSVERDLAVNHEIDESTTNLDLSLQPSVTLSVKVEDAKGKPVVNAMGNAYVMNAGGGSGGAGAKPSKSDAQGRMEIAAMPQADGYQLNVTAKGYGSAFQQMQAPAKPTNRLAFPTIVLPLANLKLAGKVLDTDGKPATGVMVQFFGQNQPNGNTQTDSQGRFSFDAVCEGSIQLNANAQGSSANAQTIGGDTNVVLRLAQYNVGVQAAVNPGQKITGTVRDLAGAPAAGVRVRVWADYGNGNEVKTDSEGRYSVNWQRQNYGGGQMTPSIIARDVEHDLAVSHDIDDTTTNLDLKLQPGLTLSVKVQDVNGKPLPTATENLTLWAGNMGFSFSQIPARADEQGVIEIKGLPQERRYSATITAKGYGSANPQAQVGDTQTTRFEFPTAVLRVADRKLAGQVLGPDSKPVPGANVSMQGNGQPFGNTTTDARGHFAFEAVCEGMAQLFANSQGGGANYMYGNIQAQGGDTNVVIRFGVNGQGMAANAQMVTTSGKVLDASGAPVAGARLSVVPGTGMNMEVRSDADGKYSIVWQAQNAGARGAAAARRGGTAAPAITYLLVGRDLEHNLAAAVEIDDKATNNVDLHLQTALTLTGSVKDPGGAPVKNAMVRLTMWAGRRGGSLGQQQPATVDSEGAFSVSPLPQGQRYGLNVTATGYGSASRQVAAAETQMASLQLPPITLKVANVKLEGQVVDGSDKPVSGAQVQISGTDQPNDNTSTDSKGHFVFNHVCEGQVRVFAYNQNNVNGGAMPSGNVQAQGGDLNVVVKLGANQGVAGPAVRQAPPRTNPPKEQSWTWTTLRNWPQKHKTAVIVLLCLQMTASLGAAGSIIWLTRHRGG